MPMKFNAFSSDKDIQANNISYSGRLCRLSGGAEFHLKVK